MLSSCIKYKQKISHSLSPSWGMVTESLKSNVVASQVFDSITANFETLGLQTFKVHEIDKASDP